MGEVAGGGKLWAKLGGRDGGGEGGEVGVAGPGEGFGGVERARKWGVGAVERAAVDVEMTSTCDAAVGVPAVAGDEAIKQERLERGAGGGESAGGIGQVGGGEEASGGDVEDEDAGVGSEAGGVGDGGGPGIGRGGVGLGMNRGVGSDERAGERELECRGTHGRSIKHQGAAA